MCGARHGARRRPGECPIPSSGTVTSTCIDHDQRSASLLYNSTRRLGRSPETTRNGGGRGPGPTIARRFDRGTTSIPGTCFAGEEGTLLFPRGAGVADSRRGSIRPGFHGQPGVGERSGACRSTAARGLRGRVASGWGAHGRILRRIRSWAPRGRRGFPPGRHADPRGRVRARPLRRGARFVRLHLRPFDGRFTFGFEFRRES